MTENRTIDKDGITTVTLTETGLHIEVTIDETGTNFFVADMISGTKTPIYGAGRPDGTKPTTDEIVAVVKNMLSTARRLP